MVNLLDSRVNQFIHQKYHDLILQNLFILGKMVISDISVPF